MDFIFGNDVENDHLFSVAQEFEEERKIFFTKFICSLYRHKYNSCFKEFETLPELMNGESVSHANNLIENMRNRTWQKTLIDQNTLPTYEAICFHARRTSLVLHVISEASTGM